MNSTNGSPSTHGRPSISSSGPVSATTGNGESKKSSRAECNQEAGEEESGIQYASSDHNFKYCLRPSLDLEAYRSLSEEKLKLGVRLYAGNNGGFFIPTNSMPQIYSMAINSHNRAKLLEEHARRNKLAFPRSSLLIRPGDDERGSGDVPELARREFGDGVAGSSGEDTDSDGHSLMSFARQEMDDGNASLTPLSRGGHSGTYDCEAWSQVEVLVPDRKATPSLQVHSPFSGHDLSQASVTPVHSLEQSASSSCNKLHVDQEVKRRPASETSFAFPSSSQLFLEIGKNEKPQSLPSTSSLMSIRNEILNLTKPQLLDLLLSPSPGKTNTSRLVNDAFNGHCHISTSSTQPY